MFARGGQGKFSGFLSGCQARLLTEGMRGGGGVLFTAEAEKAHSGVFLHPSRRSRWDWEETWREALVELVLLKEAPGRQSRSAAEHCALWRCEHNKIFLVVNLSR